MEKIRSILIPFVLLSVVLAGCEESTPLDDEQYIKQAYIVGADETTNMGMSVVDVAYSDAEETETSISVATGGSLNIDRDITVDVEEAGPESIDDYNFKYLNDDDVHYQLLDASYYRIPDREVTIKKGEVYGTMPIYINSSGLNCDSLYALTFRIKSVSDPDYISVRSQDTVLILTFNFVNDYSGSYQLDGYYYKWADGAALGDSTTISTSRTLKAVDSHTVRFYHLAKTEDTANLEDNGITLTVSADNSVSVMPWNSLELTDGGGTYDAGSQTFTVWYNYLSGSTEYQLSGKLVYSSE